MALKHSYTLLAPIYDFVVAGALDSIRQKSIARINHVEGKKILINGIGSGLDIPYLPPDANYTGTDITPAMLKLAKKQAQLHSFDIELLCTDCQALPFEDEEFDIILMHLILAVVPRPIDALKESNRVLKPGGKIYILDKFLKPGQLAPVRRIINLLSRHIATRMDVIFEDLLDQCNQLQLISNKPALANGWFRLIELEKLSVGCHQRTAKSF